MSTEADGTADHWNQPKMWLGLVGHAGPNNRVDAVGHAVTEWEGGWVGEVFGLRGGDSLPQKPTDVIHS
jgi:hypothetical protein